MTDFYAPLETIAEAQPGMVWGDCYRDTYKATAAMKAGIMVSNIGTANFKTCKSPAASTDTHIGATEYLPARAPTGDGVNEYAAGDLVSVVRKGQIYLISEAAMSVGDPVFARYTANGGNTLLGAIRVDADTARALQVPGARVVKPSVTVNGVILTLVDLNLPS